MLASRTARALALGLVAAAGLVASAAGCTVTNPDFCCSTLDSCRAVGVDAPVGCDDPIERTCDDEGAHGPAHACIADPGPPDCTGPASCPDPSAPRCDADDTGDCVRCASNDDCTRFTSTPYCDGAGAGGCVACLTSANCTAAAAPVCGADHTCRTCAGDDECAGGVCSLAGTCPAADDIIYVDASAPAGNVACTRAAPCPTITLGLAAVTGARHTMKLTGVFREAVVIDARTVEIDGRGAELIVAGGFPSLDVRGASNVIVRGLRVHDGNSRALRCADSTVEMHEVSLDNNLARAIEASSCTLTVERSSIIGNLAGGVSAQSGRTTIRNTIIARNGNPNFGSAAVTALDAVSLVIEFDTIADNTPAAMSGGPAGLACLTPLQARITNNIIVGDSANQVEGNGCAPTYTLSTETIAGTGNLVGRPTFASAATGDYHLAAGSLGVDAADPASTITVDIDGQPRPNGGRSDLGADEVH